MPLLPTDQKDQAKVFVGVVAVALAGLYWTYPYTSATSANEAMLERVERLETANEKAQRETQQGRIAALQAEAARSRATLAVLRRLVPTEHEVPALLEQVSTAARRAGLELGGVQPEPVLAGESFDTHRYKVTLVGGYHPLATFLANVGSLSRIVAPVTFQLLPSPQNAASASTAKPKAALKNEVALKAQLTIQTYVMRPMVDSLRAGTPAGGGADAVGARIAERTSARGGEVLP
ncbi:MAG TPA: type 4a pilus biogenesis protein PilO [Gemmatirosa sp.]|nr:type 4a pilus biogenesis protein PilO [Gemmatirosa sp.]